MDPYQAWQEPIEDEVEEPPRNWTRADQQQWVRQRAREDAEREEERAKIRAQVRARLNAERDAQRVTPREEREQMRRHRRRMEESRQQMLNDPEMQAMDDPPLPAPGPTPRYGPAPRFGPEPSPFADWANDEGDGEFEIIPGSAADAQVLMPPSNDRLLTMQWKNAYRAAAGIPLLSTDPADAPTQEQIDACKRARPDQYGSSSSS